MKFKEFPSTQNYLKLSAGQSAKGVFRGEPHEFRQHWRNKQSFVCTGSDCALCKEGEKSSFRFRLNFIIQENGAYVAKVFEQGKTVYEVLKALHESDYDLEKHAVKITRHGSGTDTTYSIVPLPNGGVTKEFEKELSKVELNNLSGQTSQPDEE